MQRFMQRYKLKIRIPIPTKGIRLYCYNIVNSYYFDRFIILCIILNVVLMSITFNGINYDIVKTILIINYVFLIIFNLEIILKIIGLGINFYFKDI